MTRFIDLHKATFGVEPICRTLGIAPSSYYAATSRGPSARRVRDAELATAIRRVHAENFGVYGVRKVWLTLLREGIAVGRDRVARLMRAEGLTGVRRGRQTTTPGPRRSRHRPTTSSAAASPRPLPTGSGSPTSRTSRWRGAASATPRS